MNLIKCGLLFIIFLFIGNIILAQNQDHPLNKFIREIINNDTTVSLVIVPELIR